MTFIWSSLCTLGLFAGLTIGATQDLPAPQLDANALHAPTLVVASAD